MSRLVDLTDLKESYQNEFLQYIDSFPSPKEHGVSNSFLLENTADALTPPDCKSVVFILTPNVAVIDSTQAFVCRQQEAYQLVQGLMRFQSLYGLFPVLRAKGDKAKEVAKMLLRMRQEADMSKSCVTPFAELEPQTDMLILLDRSVDPLTPLLSQLTYEGLISEKWGIQYGVCRFDGEVGLSPKISKRLPLTSKDEVFNELRDQSFVSVGSTLGRRSKEISARIHVLRLICLQSFCNGGLKQRLLEYYKREVLQVYGFEHMFTLDNLDRVGLLYDSSTISSSEGSVPRVSLAPSSVSKQNSIVTRRTVTAVSSMFGRTLRRSLRLVIPPSTTSDPSDTEQQLAQIYSSYIPLSVRLIQAMVVGWPPKLPGGIAGQISTANSIPTAIALGKRLVSKLSTATTNGGGGPVRGQSPAPGIPIATSVGGPGSSQDGGNFVLSLMPGVHFEETQFSGEYVEFNKNKTSMDKRNNKMQVIVVTFIGGVTHAEISVLRKLAAIYATAREDPLKTAAPTGQHP
ncbi:unnamed protein product [Echinostoma caproni]|uniref:Vacuolar protein sorting-associated protein 33A n=1 Tax=Echinostoma caproni TaxID=27848 RepID=A0A183AIH9_9TREM|nr:unnamed protein product [Echinostoma caproni]